MNGLVALRGKEVGIDASLHAKINEIVNKVESGKVQASPSLVADL